MNDAWQSVGGRAGVLCKERMMGLSSRSKSKKRI